MCMYMLYTNKSHMYDHKLTCAVHVVWCTVNVYNVSNFCVYSIIRLVVDFHIYYVIYMNSTTCTCALPWQQGGQLAC